MFGKHLRQDVRGFSAIQSHGGGQEQLRTAS